MGFHYKGFFVAAALVGLPCQASAQNTEHRVYAPPESITCEAAAAMVSSGNPAEIDPAVMDMHTMRHRECQMTVWNQAHPDDKRVTIASYDPGAQKVLFGTISLRDAESLRNGCRTVASVITASEFSGDPLTFAIAGVAGNYGCDSYLQAAATNNPMLLLLPTHVPSFQMATDTWRELRRVINRVPNREIGGTIPGTPIPLIVVAPSVATMVAAAEPIENVRREADRVLGNVTRETGNVATNVRDEARRACRRIWSRC